MGPDVSLGGCPERLCFFGFGKVFGFRIFGFSGFGKGVIGFSREWFEVHTLGV